MAPKHKSSASKPKKSRDVLSINEKVKILDMMEIKEILFGDCQVVWQERIFHSWSDEQQRKKIHVIQVGPRIPAVYRGPKKNGKLKK